MKFNDLKVEVYYEESNGYLSLRWNIYDSVSGKSPKLDKALYRFAVTLLAQASQQIAMQNDIYEMTKMVNFSIEKE